MHHILLIIPLLFNGNVKTENATVVNVNPLTETVCVSANEEKYEFYGHGYNVGESVIVTINTNGNENPFDDEIVDCVQIK